MTLLKHEEKRDLPPLFFCYFLFISAKWKKKKNVEKDLNTEHYFFSSWQVSTDTHIADITSPPRGVTLTPPRFEPTLTHNAPLLTTHTKPMGNGRSKEVPTFACKYTHKKTNESKKRDHMQRTRPPLSLRGNLAHTKTKTKKRHQLLPCSQRLTWSIYCDIICTDALRMPKEKINRSRFLEHQSFIIRWSPPKPPAPLPRSG